jgi:hypothetical protein
MKIAAKNGKDREAKFCLSPFRLSAFPPPTPELLEMMSQLKKGQSKKSIAAIFKTVEKKQNLW